MTFIQATDMEVAEMLQAERRRELSEHLASKLSAALREWWSFNEQQQHTHSWHTREDFIEKLPAIIEDMLK